jgi:hypothetical protein
VGPKSTTVPQAGLDTKARAGPLARSIVDELVKDPKLDPDRFLNYNPVNWRDANNVPFNASTNWLQPVVSITINHQQDAFSPRYVSSFCLINRAPLKLVQAWSGVPTRRLPLRTSD